MYLVELIETLLETTVGVMAAAADDPWLRADLLEAMGVADSPALQAQLAGLQQPLGGVPVIDAAVAGGAEVASWLAAANAVWAALDGMGAFGAGEAAELAIALGTTGMQMAVPAAYHVAIALGFIVPFEPAARPTTHLYDTVDRAAIADFLAAPRAYVAGRFPALDLTSDATIAASIDAFLVGWGRVLSAIGIVWTRGFDPTGLGAPDEALLRRMVTFEPWNDDDTAAAGLAVSGVPDGGGEGGLVVAPFGTLALAGVRGGWQLEVTGQASPGGLQFGGDAGLRVVGGGPAGALALTAEHLGGEVVAGAGGGTSVTFGAAKVGATLGVSAGGVVWTLAGEVKEVTLVVAADEGDGFLRTVLGDGSLRATMSLAADLDAERGLRFRGSGGLMIETGVRIVLGPFELARLAASVDARPERITAAVTGAVGVRLGPVRVVLERLGLELAVRIEPATVPGEPWIRHGFKGPDGAGITIDAGVASGAGMLVRDGSVYTGALVLDVRGLTLAGYGVLDARGDGYSLAAVIAATFPPMPLGLGFHLDGVGGLIGVNRRIDVDALRDALRGPGLGDLFFGADPLAHAARLATDLARYFPAAGGRHVIGPAVRLGWGTPTLVRATLALLVEVPSPVRLVLLGTAAIALPTESQPIIALNVDVVGEVDFARKTAAVDAALRDSHVAGFPITGELALRMAWGDPPSFALAVGGFHSQFRPPPGFPALRRVRIPVGSGENPRLDIEGFLALTSNTAQVGAAIDLYVAAGPLNIVGNVGFEALIQFVPFAFQVDLRAGVALRRGTRVLAGVHLDGTLRGPTPWHFAGEACLSLWFVDLCVGFDATFGTPRTVELPPSAVWPLLLAALQDPRSWSAALPPGAARAAVLAAPVDDLTPASRIDPATALSVRQKVVPLNRPIERFGEVPPSDHTRFDLAGAQLGTAALPPPAPIEDWFAPAQFEALTDDEKLSRPGYERMVAGGTLASDGFTTGRELPRPLAYETIKFPDPAPLPGFHRPDLAAQLDGVATSGAATAPLRPPRAAVPLVTLAEETFVIASTEDLAPRLDIVPASSRSAAELALKAYVAANPAARGALQVVPRFELGPPPP